MKHIKFAYIALLVLILSLSAVYAQTGSQATYEVDNSTNIHVTLIDTNKDFMVQSPYSGFDACKCGSIVDPIQITNTGSFASQYTLSANLDYVVFSQQTIEVLPGETKEVMAYLEVPCDEKNTQELEVFITSSFQDTKVLRQELHLNTCKNLVAGVYNNSIDNGVCEPFTTRLRVDNTGSFHEIYSIEPQTFPDYVTLSTQEIAIAPGESKDVFAHYNLPCNIYGDHELEYTISASKNQQVVSLRQQLHIPQDYDVSVLGPQNVTVCDEITSSYDINLQNNNNFTDTYEAYTKKPSFVDIGLPVVDGKKQHTFSLEPQETITLPITVRPEKKHVGQHDITFDITSQNGDITKTLSTNLTVQNCIELHSNVFTPSKDIQACGGMQETHQVEFENKGVGYAQVGLGLEGMTTASLNTTHLEFEGTQSHLVDLTVFPDASLNHSVTYPVVIDAYVGNTVEQRQRLDVIVQPKETCFNAQPKHDSLYAYYQEDNVTLVLKNKGLREAVFHTEYVGLPDYLETSVSDKFIAQDGYGFITFDLNHDIIAQMQPDNLSQAQPLQDTFTLVLTHQESGAQHTYTIDTEIAFQHPWYINAYHRLQQTSPCTLVTFALAGLFVLGAVLYILRVSSPRRHHKSRKLLGIILLALIVLSALVVGFVYGIPQKSDYYNVYDLETNSTRYLLVEEDKEQTFNLHRFFYDPDGDITSFDVLTYNESLFAYELEDDQLTLQPRKDMYGSSTLVLSATDSYNQTAVSEDITVELLAQNDYSAWELHSLLCPYCNLVLLVLVALAAWLWASQQKRTPKQSTARPKVKKVTRKTTKAKKARKSAKKKSARRTSAKKTATKKTQKRKKTAKKRSSSKGKRKTSSRR